MGGAHSGTQRMEREHKMSAFQRGKPGSVQAVVSENPWAEFHGEPEVVRTYDFTYAQQAMTEGLKLALKVQENPATQTEAILAYIIIEICKAVGMASS